MSKEQDHDNNPATDHEYDGIREYDNPLPNWWLMIFFGTIIFSFIYFAHYTFGGGQTQEEELAEDLSRLPKIAEKTFSESDLAGKVDQADVIAQGQAVFASKCGACHGAEGQGLIGPNLTDSFWVHGTGQRKDIAQVISKGVLDKGMPAWDGVLPENELLAVTGYIYSLRGTKPANPKAPEGNEVKN